MRTRHSRGLTRIELVVLLLVIAVALATLLTAVSSARETGRRIQCQNNMRNLGLALVNYSTSKNWFPRAGTFYDDPAVHQGDPLRSSIYQAVVNPGGGAGVADSCLYSWVIDVLPYLDCADCYNAWDKRKPYLSNDRANPIFPSTSNASEVTTGIGVLRCPDDGTAEPGRGNLSYVVNGGFARWHAIPVGWSGSPLEGRATSGSVLQWVAPEGDWTQTQAIGKKLGVMFLGTQSGDQPWDIVTTPADCADGMATTLLLGENTLVGYAKGTRYSGGLETNWACPLPNFAMFLASDDVCRTPRSATDCQGGQLQPGPTGADGPGWRRANQAGTFENINYGQRFLVEGSFPFANSAHPGGSNFVFCDGAVRFLRSTVDGALYANLITPAGTLLPPHLRQSQISDSVIEP
jgi:prepilin-type processing-associated H-X9-DG protein